MDIQWFPGHMANAVKNIKAQRGAVDVFLELLDARAPLACRNPLLDSLIDGKPRVVILTKADIADPAISVRWMQYFNAQPATRCLLVSASERQNVGAIAPTAIEFVRSLKPKAAGTVRAMIVGIPNVGKSSLINTIARAKKTSVAPKPGHTKGPQRVMISDAFELIDTPGVLWHKFEDKDIAIQLAMMGAIKDDTYDFHALCLLVIEFLCAHYPGALAARYRIDAGQAPAPDLLEAIARARGYLVKGGIDIERTCTTLMNDFRSGALGRISLASPPLPGA